MLFVLYLEVIWGWKFKLFVFMIFGCIGFIMFFVIIFGRGYEFLLLFVIFVVFCWIIVFWFILIKGFEGKYF